MGKGKKKPDPRGYATTSIPSKTSEAMLAAAKASVAAPSMVRDAQVTERIKAAKEAKESVAVTPEANVLGMKKIKAFPLPNPPDRNAAVVSLKEEDEERLIDVIRTLRLPEENKLIPTSIASRFQLETVYETLVEAGFMPQDVETVMRKCGEDLEAALDWLSWNLPSERLPASWTGNQKQANDDVTKSNVSSVTGSVCEQFRTFERRQQQQTKAASKRDIVMMDDVLDIDGRQQQALADNERRAKKIEETKQAIAAAKAKGDTDEQKRLGKLMVFLRNPDYVIPPSPKGADKSKSELSESQKLLMAALEDSDVRSLKKGAPPTDESVRSSAELSKDVKETVAAIPETVSSAIDPSIQALPTEPKSAADEELMSLGMFDEEEDDGSSKPSGVSYGLPRFQGSIPSSWRSATPKSLLGDLLKKRGDSPPKHVREKKGVKVKVPHSETEDMVFEAGLKCNNQAIEEEVAAMRALYLLFKESYSALEIQLPPDFRDLWKEWMLTDARAAEERAELNARPRREFVGLLLDEFADRVKSSSDASSSSTTTSSIAPTVSDAGATSVTLSSSSGSKRSPIWTLPDLAQKLQSSKRLLNVELPIFAIKDEFLSAHFSNDFVVVVGETGSGKTTQIPQFLLDGWVAQMQTVPRIAISEPRRVSATSVCKRVSEELGDDDYGLSAYQIRGETTNTPRTCLLFCTTGILLRRAIDDPLFLQIDVIVIDEVHERSLDSDVLMVLVKSAVEQRRARKLSPLKVVLMSATINAERLSAYCGGCPVVKASGRTFAVQQYYLEDAVEMTGYDHFNDSDMDDSDLVVDDLGEPLGELSLHAKKKAETLDDPKYSPRTRKSLMQMDETKVNHVLIEKILGLVSTMPETKQGAILVFLPGLRDILALESRLLGSKQFGNATRYLIVPLHSSLSNVKQVKLVFDPPPKGTRKIVLSTNIAETGVTIPDVTVVVDTCRVNQISFNEKRGLVILSERFCSKSSAEQRTGRAGRVQEGVAFRLVSRATFLDKFDKFTSPEIHRVPLDQVCLSVLVQQWDPRDFFPMALDPPSPDAVSKALQRLEKLGAVILGKSLPSENNPQKSTSVTPLGVLLARLPVDAHIGKMVVYGAMFGCCRIACTIAAIASAEKSIFRSDSQRKTNRLQVLDSDLITDARVFLEWERSPNKTQFVRENHLDFQRLWEIQNARDQLLSCVRSDLGMTVKDDMGEDWRVVSAVIAAGTHLCQVRFPDSLQASRYDLPDHAVRYTCADGTEAHLAKSSLAFGHGKGALRPGEDGPRRTRFYAYCERIKTHKVYLRDLSPVHPAAVLLLATEVKPYLLVRRVDIEDGWTHVRCSPRTYALFSQFRRGMNLALQSLFVPSSVDQQQQPASKSLLSKGEAQRVIDHLVELLRIAE